VDVKRAQVRGDEDHQARAVAVADDGPDAGSPALLFSWPPFGVGIEHVDRGVVGMDGWAGADFLVEARIAWPTAV
jgi:hypothetical protein